jgi:hypothetical protein
MIYSVLSDMLYSPHPTLPIQSLMLYSPHLSDQPMYLISYLSYLYIIPVILIGVGDEVDKKFIHFIV